MTVVSSMFGWEKYIHLHVTNWHPGTQLGQFLKSMVLTY